MSILDVGGEYKVVVEGPTEVQVGNWVQLKDGRRHRQLRVLTRFGARLYSTWKYDEAGVSDA